ncbi:hypothetical protein HYS48_02045 [Candidatus Woesearchaeota archaeon]|nr:hypothetical protein [Candidatus Woesearchaeota archaeon]
MEPLDANAWEDLEKRINNLLMLNKACELYKEVKGLLLTGNHEQSLNPINLQIAITKWEELQRMQVCYQGTPLEEEVRKLSTNIESQAGFVEEILHGIKGRVTQIHESFPFPLPKTPYVRYKDLLFEKRAPRKKGPAGHLDDKKEFEYLISCATLKLSGYVRHPRPWEVFSLLIDYLEGKLSREQIEVAEDILRGGWEWLSSAFERKGDILTAYIDPVGLYPQSEPLKDAPGDSKMTGYRKKDFRSTDWLEFDISGIESEKAVPLKKFDDRFVRFLTGCSYRALPRAMRTFGRYRVYVYLPKDNTIGHVWCGYGDSNRALYVLGSGGYRLGSRGVMDINAERALQCMDIEDLWDREPKETEVSFNTLRRLTEYRNTLDILRREGKEKESK